MTKILLTRHGHVDGIRPARFRGRAELALTERGLAQAGALARRIAANWKPVAVFTSPLQRCVLTGGKIAAACGIKGEVRDGLGDIDYGTWQMRTHEEVSAESPQAYRQWHAALQRAGEHGHRLPGGSDALGQRVGFGEASFGHRQFGAAAKTRRPDAVDMAVTGQQDLGHAPTVAVGAAAPLSFSGGGRKRGGHTTG